MREVMIDDLPTPSSPTRHTLTSRATILAAGRLWSGEQLPRRSCLGGDEVRARARPAVSKPDRTSKVEPGLLPGCLALRQRSLSPHATHTYPTQMTQGFKGKAPKSGATPGKQKSTATRAKLQPKDPKKGGQSSERTHLRARPKVGSPCSRLTGVGCEFQRACARRRTRTGLRRLSSLG